MKIMREDRVAIRRGTLACDAKTRSLSDTVEDEV